VVWLLVTRAWASRATRLLYCNGMTHRVGAKGQVVIPKDLRERAGLRPGADVEFELDGQRVSIKAARGRLGLGGRFAQSGMAERLLEDRSREPR
jgi:AbrB family looped-hinge helix DNA binding protein